MATTVADKPIGTVFAVRSLLFLLLLNGALANNLTYSESISIAVDTINWFRAAVSPHASDMLYMAWNEDLAKEATELAKSCKWVLPKPGVIHSSWPSDNHSVEMIQYHLKEGRNAVNYRKCNSDEARKFCRFYRDLMEAGADRIGCGNSECPNNRWLYYCVTNARSSNEPFTDLVYTKGTPCQRCPKSAGYCYRNLCVSHATKTAIQAETPSAVITCDAPCMNCGERKEANNSCFCQCEGYSREVDCSKGYGSLSLTCTPCRLDGTPCRNGGREVGSRADPCRCLCNDDYGGPFCEIPLLQVVGGVVLPIKFAANEFSGLTDVETLTAKLKNEMADGINLFCGENETNYLMCCGYGTLPTNGPTDFVDASSVHVTCTPTAEFSSRNGICTIYATAKGDNGLCRKQTLSPAPTLAVPPSVVKTVFKDRFAGKRPCCHFDFEADADYYNDYFKFRMQMNYISVKVG